MKNFALVLCACLMVNFLSAQPLKPYILGFETTENVSVVAKKLVTALNQNEIEVIGQYQPAEEEGRWIIVFTSSELKAAVQEVGGLTGFAAALRLGITRENDKTIVSYTNPIYWGTAYFREDFNKVASKYAMLTKHLEGAMKASGSFDGTPFGSEKGIEVDKLKKYRYMMGMAQFDNTIKLGSFDNHQAALKRVESSLQKGVPNVTMIYKVAIPGKDLTLYGFGLSGEDGETKFLPKIDISNPRHTAFLPYEMLVKGNEVHMMHGRFRIALSFPDLTMGTFTKIMSTPPTIKKMLAQLVED
jgi:hypothetical protein